MILYSPSLTANPRYEVKQEYNNHKEWGYRIDSRRVIVLSSHTHHEVVISSHTPSITSRADLWKLEL